MDNIFQTCLAYLAKYFSLGNNGYGSELEQYITNKRPTNAAEIEHWAREFEYEKTRNFSWGRGL
jgi:hypothetical protein